MQPVGRDSATPGNAAISVSQISANPDGKTWTFDFDALNLAQVPSFILISCPRLSETRSSTTMQSGPWRTASGT